MLFVTTCENRTELLCKTHISLGLGTLYILPAATCKQVTQRCSMTGTENRYTIQPAELHNTTCRADYTLQGTYN